MNQELKLRASPVDWGHDAMLDELNPRRRAGDADQVAMLLGRTAWRRSEERPAGSEPKLDPS